MTTKTEAEPGPSEVTYIVELPHSSVQLIAQVLHLFLAANPKNRLVRKVMTGLRQQTSLVSKNAELHDVFPKVFEAPVDCEAFPPVMYRPLS